jgi:prepilin-type N-terminal cleavage/methylation domain-containing protein
MRHPKSHRPRFRRQGYSLIEMAVVIAVFSLVGGTMLSVATMKAERRQAAGLAERLDFLEEAILYYYRQFGHLPCPASASAPENTANFGRATDCAAAAPAGTADAGAGTDAVRTGIVPTRTLAIADSAMFDPWGNRISYTVIKDLAKDSGTFTAYTTALTTGVIRIVDLNGNQVVNDDGKTIIAYALVSHGKNGKGAANRLGTVTTACDNAAKDGENCNNDAVIRDTDIQDGTIAANYYDDFVRWKEMDALGASSAAAGASSTLFDIGDFNVCAMKADNTVWCWGLNDGGQLGDGTTTDRSSPVQVSGLTNAAQLASNSWHSCAVKTDGTAWCWGWNPDGRLGDGTTTNRTTPVQVSGLTSVSQMDTGDHHTCALKTDGTVWCWGLNHDQSWGTGGQIGNGTWGDNPLTPVQVGGGLSNVKQVSTGYLHTCAVKNDGTAWCWGSNRKSNWGIDTGQLGDGTFVDRYSPVQVSGLSNVIEIKAGDQHTCALKIDGTVWCWGGNNWGQLGDGTTMSRLTPVQVVGFTGAVSVKVGERNTCAGKNDGTIWCWGLNDKGQLGNGATTNSLVPVQVLSMP